jgi:hypothetical protein
MPQDVEKTSAAENDWPGFSRKPSFRNPLGLPGPLSTKQLLYLGFTQCIGAACICRSAWRDTRGTDASVAGGANFAIACAMYR